MNIPCENVLGSLCVLIVDDSSPLAFLPHLQPEVQVQGCQSVVSTGLTIPKLGIKQAII